MVRNGYGAKYIKKNGTKWFLVMVRNGKLWYEMVMVQNTYGTKLQFCSTKWYEMVMVQNSYGTKWFLVMVRNCNFVVRNGKHMVRNGNGTKWLWYEMTSYENF